MSDEADASGAWEMEEDSRALQELLGQLPEHWHRCSDGHERIYRIMPDGEMSKCVTIGDAFRIERVALLRELAEMLNAEAYKPEPECVDPQMQAAREGYREGLKWAGKKLGWQADALEKGDAAMKEGPYTWDDVAEAMKRSEPLQKAIADALEKAGK